MDAIDVLLDAENLGYQIDAGDWATVERTYWAGIVAMRTGDYDTAVRRLETVQAFAGRHGRARRVIDAGVCDWPMRSAGPVTRRRQRRF